MASVSGFFKGIAPFFSAAASFAPGAPVLGIAASLLSKATGSQVSPNGDAIGKVMGDLLSTEDGRLKLQQAENELQETMTKLGYDHEDKLAELAMNDRASARLREQNVHDWTPRILSYLVIAAVGICEGAVLFHGAKGVDGVVLGRILGTLDSALVLVLGYYFGSSAGSDRKTELLYQSTPPQGGAK